MKGDAAMIPERPASQRKSSSVIMMVAVVDLLVIVPLTYWWLHGLGMIIAGAIEVTGILALLGLALHLRRRGL